MGYATSYRRMNSAWSPSAANNVTLRTTATPGVTEGFSRLRHWATASCTELTRLPAFDPSRSMPQSIDLGGTKNIGLVCATEPSKEVRHFASTLMLAGGSGMDISRLRNSANAAAIDVGSPPISIVDDEATFRAYA